MIRSHRAHYPQVLQFLLLAPYILGPASPDSSYDDVTFGVGMGQYASYDCGGRVHNESFKDGGVKITHKFEIPLRIGVAATVASLADHIGVAPYPDIAFDSRYFSIGTTGLRLGREDVLYGEFSVLDQVPAFSGKGFARYGIGFRIADLNSRFWLGANSLPYARTGIAAQIEFPVAENKFMFLNGRHGYSGGVSEYGISLGMRIRSY